MTTLPDLAIYIANEHPDKEVEGTLSLSNLTFDCISRLSENEYSIFASIVLDNGIEYGVSIDLNESQVQEFAEKIGEPFPSVKEGLEEEYSELFEEPSTSGIPDYDIYLSVQIRTQIQKGILKDGNGDEFIPFRYHKLDITKVSEVIWKNDNF